ncbi:hypothetical protein, partial [Mesorhizobium sp. Root552]|uniref:hypothetical protein n=1 Tax=Mesorhizobium sp. Root552 TaxID=1736555 RepID=UPI0019105256
MGRPRHQPDAYHRRQVETLAGYGIPEAEIAGLIGIDPKTLRRHYRQELDHGHTKANAKVAENLYRKATGEGREAVTAAIFWLKARAKANAKVAENLYRKATGEGREAVTAAIFWLKARARWKETNVNEIAGVPGQPLKQVHEIRRIIVSPAEREEWKRERDERVM